MLLFGTLSRGKVNSCKQEHVFYRHYIKISDNLSFSWIIMEFERYSRCSFNNGTSNIASYQQKYNSNFSDKSFISWCRQMIREQAELVYFTCFWYLLQSLHVYPIITSDIIFIFKYVTYYNIYRTLIIIVWCWRNCIMNNGYESLW